MSFRLPSYLLRRTLPEVCKTTYQLRSRAVTTQTNRLALFPGNDFFSCNSHIACDTDEKQSSVDLKILAQLQQHGSAPTAHILNRMVSSCAKSGSVFVGIQLHSTIIKVGFDSNVYICSALVDMYGKCGAVSSAQRLFDEMPHRNVVTWNSLISGYLHVGCPEIAIELFLEMVKVGIDPTPFSVSAVLVGCWRMEDTKLGIQVHGLSMKCGFCYNIVVGTCLIDLYSKGWNIDASRLMFDLMPERNIITWTSMVAGYAHCQQPVAAMVLVRDMQRLGIRLNYVTYNCLLSSFSSSNDLDHCKQVHCRIIREGLESNSYLEVTLVTVYSECSSSSLEDFNKVCSGVTRWDQISWNAVIGGLSNLGNGEAALKCFSKMRQAGIDMDLFTFTSVLRAIGMISTLDEGKQIHALVLKAGYGSNLNVQNGLVSMYARCGSINDAKRVFSLMDRHDVISWNSLLSGCAYHGYGREAVELFEQMRRSGVKPDNTTFLVVLSACRHVGLLDKGLEYFDLMRNDYSLESPTTEHYSSMVDLFSRAGYLSEAEDFINTMPIEPGPSVYKALLSACQVHGNVEIAVRCAKKLLQMCPNDPVIYVLLSNVQATVGYWDNVASIRKVMCDRGVRKEPGYSWI